MNRRSIVCILLFCACFATAEERSHSFALSVETGFLYGTSYEIVYNFAGSSRYTSELQWKSTPLWFIGLAAEYGPVKPFVRPGFFGTLEIKLGMPGKTGVIEDRDWLIPGALTHFSSHDNHTKAAVFADLGGGFSVPLTGGLLLRLSLDVSYMYLKYEAHDGYIQYGLNNHKPDPFKPYVSWDPKWAKVPINGLGMDYSQHWFIVGPGMGMVLRLWRFSLSFSLSIRPLAVCVDFDNHFLREPPFLVVGELFGGFFIEPKGGVSFALNEHCELAIKAAYRYIGETRGNATYYEYYSSGTKETEYADSAGAAYRAFQAALTFTWHF
ncbi:MAG: omptin family outer membrane protease [Treponema sp.]|nr:omptin family outer membrane protease [Treponema sp.]